MKQFLSDKEHGEKVIRPSSRGPSFLTLTLKIFDGVYAHKEITESGKDHKDITSLLRLGKTLTIDNETFEDLDEVGAPDIYTCSPLSYVVRFSYLIPFSVTRFCSS